MESKSISGAIEFLKKLKGNKEVIIQVQTKENPDRIMRCTLDFDLIPKNKRAKKLKLENILRQVGELGLFHVFDLDKGEWRSIYYDKVKWLEDENKVRYSVRKK